LGYSFFRNHHQPHLVQLRHACCLDKKCQKFVYEFTMNLFRLFAIRGIIGVRLTKGGKADMLFLPRDEGQGLVEYALILVLVAIVVIAILLLLGPVVGNVFSNIVSNL